ncbi:uncharacterized protein BDW47DRAFT_113473 [Aspergillus candidus]|uniref:Uncharacterized protein n=1 Tax=Aspergillus candidus TaxID=41067 RepID=A0A2I2EZA7_ASPCN|nr:hypothetical protein BDW47DRAFT_113473 [Aspergillus candidus]PLB33700.1 hypothetical protein BDW47DRAFT_113473 [Aspergillus candidus]
MEGTEVKYQLLMDPSKSYSDGELNSTGHVVIRVIRVVKDFKALRASYEDSVSGVLKGCRVVATTLNNA